MVVPQFDHRTFVQYPPAPMTRYRGLAMPYDNEICPVCDKEIGPTSSVAKDGDKVIHISCLRRRSDAVGGPSST
jgi:hypothetical protein